VPNRILPALLDLPSAAPESRLRCPKCDSNKFVVPDNSTADSLVTCADCGAGIGRWGDIRVGIIEEAKTERKAAPRRQKANQGSSLKRRWPLKQIACGHAILRR